LGPRLVFPGLALCFCILIALLITKINGSVANAKAVSRSPAQWELPGYLREASGLAILDANHLLVHNDEKGNLYRISLDHKAIKKWASIGVPPINRDFEGIAVDLTRPKTAGNNAVMTAYLLTSSGELVVIKDADPEALGQQVSAVAIDTGLQAICEIEGLHLHNGQLLAPCKKPLTDEHKNKLVVFSINPKTGEQRTHLSIPKERLKQAGRLRPTAIATLDDRYYIVTTNRLIVYHEKDDAIEVYKLPKKTHFQPEGIAVMPDGSLYIVDDNRRGISRLTFYQDLSELERLIN